MKAVVKDFIKNNLRHSPAQIYRMMHREEGLSEYTNAVSESQVRYVWQTLPHKSGGGMMTLLYPKRNA